MQREKNVKILNHVGIIMDGNGRWAATQGRERSYGYRFGAQNVDRIVTHAFKSGVTNLSLYAFSSENWERPKEEINEIMSVLSRFFQKFTKENKYKGVRLIVSGDLSGVSSELKQAIDACVAETKNYNKHVLNIAINYGSRQEIVFAVNKLIKEKKEINVESISSCLYTAGLLDPDLIIRTGGEKRLSNFMLYQGAYSELYFTDLLWPDFTEEEFDKAVLDFSKRKRRFGGLGETR